MRKYIAEFIGTLVLTLFGCGTAVMSGGITGVTGVLGIALAFGLSIVAMAYAIGGVSGCHINPAVSLACLVSGRMGVKDFIGYVIAQFAGGIAAAGALIFILSTSGLNVVYSGLGANGYEMLSYTGISCTGAIVVEIILTFVFVMTVLGVTASKKTEKVAGLVIGLSLAFVHIFGICLTGTSVNPARSLGPAIFTGGQALSQVWVFIVAPLAGGVIAALIYKILYKNSDKALEDEIEETNKEDNDMVNFHVTYYMGSKEDRDNYFREVRARGIIDKSRAEDGCHRYEFYLPTDSVTSLFLWEQWETREHQTAHCQTAHFAEMGELKAKYNVETKIDIVD